MALSPEQLAEIKSYMDARAEGWKADFKADAEAIRTEAAKSSQEAVAAAQTAARGEIKAADERIAKRNTVFGVGVGAVLLSAVGFGYGSVTGSVSSIAETAKAEADQIADIAKIEAVRAATTTAEQVAQAQFDEGERLFERQEQQIEALIEARSKVEVLLNAVNEDVKTANKAVAGLQASQSEVEELASEATELIEKLNAQTEPLKSLRGEIESLANDLSTRLSEAEQRSDESRDRARELQIAEEELSEVSGRLEDAYQLLEAVINADDGRLEEAAGSLVSLALGDKTLRQSIVDVAALPSGTVLVVDDVDGCPTGWSQFEPAAGRTIIGVGRGIVDRPGGQDTDLTLRVWRQTGGEEAVKLSEAEMPSHNHEFTYSFGDRDGSFANFDHENGPRIRTGFNTSSRWSKQTTEYESNASPVHRTGGSQPHNNMPPYIALYFCKKD